MKMFFNKTAGFLIFSSIAVFAALDAPAQKINDDLQQPTTKNTTQKKTVKKTPVAKTTTSTRKKTTKTVKKKSATTAASTTSATTPVSVPVTTATTTTSSTTPVNTPATTNVSTPFNNQSTVTQTPVEILKRFIDFQQSSGVTARDWESVVAQTNTSLQENPNDTTVKAQLFVAQGQLAFMRGDFANALIHFNAAAEVLPASALPHYGIGKVYLATKQPAEAEEAFQRAIKNDKNFALAYKGMGEVMTAQNKAKRADYYFKQAAKIGLANASTVVPQQQQQNTSTQNNQNVQNSVPTTGSSGALTLTPYQAELKEAKKLTARKKWQASLDKLESLSKTDQTAEVFMAMGENYLGMRQFLSAQQAFRKATEIDPKSAVAFFKLGSVLFELNEFQSAHESFEKALILDQQGTTINRQIVRKWADRANERVKDSKDGKKKFLGIGMF